MHKTMHPTHEQPGYGDAHYASPTKSGTKAMSQSYEASKRFSAQGESGRSSYHEAQTKYLPTHREAVTGYHFPAKEYGYGDHAHPTLERSGYGNDFTDISAGKRYAG